MNYKIIIPIVILAISLTVLFFLNFERQDVLAMDWTEHYLYDSEDPYGTSLLVDILSEAYGEENVVKTNSLNYFPIDSDQKSKAYLAIGDYISYANSEIDSICRFVSAGNDAIFITSSLGYNLDSIFQYIYREYDFTDTSITLSIAQQDSSYHLTARHGNLDTASQWYFTFIDMDGQEEYSISDSLDIEDSIHYEPLYAKEDYTVLSYANEEFPVMVKIKYGDGHFYVHSVPYAYSNLAIKREGMSSYVTSTLPLLDIDTLYLDHTYYMNNHSSAGDSNPLQFIMSQPPLKYAYYLAVVGLFLFVISRAKRRQREIPVLPLNENTSREYVNTISELYRSQRQHHKLAVHLKQIFTQRVKEKYFLKPDQSDYIQRIAQKSKIPEKEINKLINRIDAAKNNARFDDTQLTNLYKDLDHFYKNCN